MILRVVRMTFQQDRVNDFLQNFKSNKEKIRNFPGCRYLELWQDEHHKNIFITYSHWESEEALNQYRDSELFKTVWGYTKTLFAAKPMAFSAKKIEELP
ncbi:MULTISPECIES: putative quinol monooxygenase [Mariniradius]|jgi:quinol monooxygenase YgiN|nr:MULTISPECIES: antibiotic biosynthesis monooxygenase family protein [Mariniradius]MCF1750612.1 antibiotic biosynthesis monooxygenase [Mariniradius sediminis]